MRITFFDFEKWRKLRGKGKWNFILIYGVLWGIGSALLFSLIIPLALGWIGERVSFMPVFVKSITDFYCGSAGQSPWASVPAVKQRLQTVLSRAMGCANDYLVKGIAPDESLRKKFDELGVQVINTNGVFIVSTGFKSDGVVIIDAKDENGVPIVKKMIYKAMDLPFGRTDSIVYSWKNKDDPISRDKMTLFAYISEWNWVVFDGDFID
ncbi:MAG: Cache 3/Cache 2 fusion domain-containing protein [Verrucomicrobiae bacterium]|nr:Cache 3/Cache 2 fusion domain-containing protein [Verrucomicrobiae bacterium]